MASLYGFAIKCAVPTVLGGVVNRADHGRGALAFSVRGSVPAWVTVGLRLWFPEQSNLPWSLPCLLLLPAPCEPRAWLDEQPRLCPKRELRSLARAPPPGEEAPVSLARKGETRLSLREKPGRLPSTLPGDVCACVFGTVPRVGVLCFQAQADVFCSRLRVFTQLGRRSWHLAEDCHPQRWF